MEINIHNYESVLIDYFDGNLTALEVAEVLLFLEQHPDLKNEFESLGTLPEPETLEIEPDFKSQLKKTGTTNSIAQKSFNELIVAQMEGDCNAQENELINKLFEGNASLTKLKSSFLLTRLIPDLFIIYPDKQALKRKEAVVFYLNRKFAAAAAILLLASLVFLVYLNANKNIDKIELAQSNDAVLPTKISVENTKENLVSTAQKSVSALEKKQLNTVDADNTKNNIKPVITEENNTEKYNALASMQTQPLVFLEKSMASEFKTIQGDVLPVEHFPVDSEIKKENFLSISDWMKKELIDRSKNNLVEKEKPVNTENLTIEPITIASVGAGIVEKTTGKKVLLARSYDKAGAVKSYTFAAGNFKFERIK